MLFGEVSAPPLGGVGHTVAFVLEGGAIRAHPVLPAALLARLRRRRVPAASRRGRNPDRQRQRAAAHQQNPQSHRVTLSLLPVMPPDGGRRDTTPLHQLCLSAWVLRAYFQPANQQGTRRRQPSAAPALARWLHSGGQARSSSSVDFATGIWKVINLPRKTFSRRGTGTSRRVGTMTRGEGIASKAAGHRAVTPPACSEKIADPKILSKRMESARSAAPRSSSRVRAGRVSSA